MKKLSFLLALVTVFVTGSYNIVDVNAGSTYILKTTTGGRGSGTVSQGGEYVSGETVTITATPSAGSKFAGWNNGDCTGRSLTCTLKMDRDRKANANFDLLKTEEPVSSYVSFKKTGSGKIIDYLTVSGDDESKGSAKKKYTNGKEITLFAIPNEGNVFVGWKNGKCQGQKANCSFVMKGETTEEAIFAKSDSNVRNITMIAFDPNTGAQQNSVTFSGLKESYIVGETATITAVPPTGSVFLGWNGKEMDNRKCRGQGATCTFVVDKNMIQYAAVAKANEVESQKMKVQVRYGGNGKGKVLVDGKKLEDRVEYKFTGYSKKTFIAIPDDGSVFVEWTHQNSNCYGKGAVCETILDENVGLYPIFSLKGDANKEYTLSVNKVGEGTVTGTGNYKMGTYVILKATPSTGYVFTKWEGGSCGWNPGFPSCGVTMDGNKQEKAVFTKIPGVIGGTAPTGASPTVTAPAGTYNFVTSTGSRGSGTVTGGGNYPAGVYATITAIPAPGSKFAGWNNGDCTGRSLTCTVLMDRDRKANANFDLLPTSMLNTEGVLSSDSSVSNVIDLEFGMAHPSVITLQKYLNSHGYVINSNVGEEGSIGYETNYFGQKTKQALIKFQKDKGISPAQGFYGPQTRREMGI